MINISSSVYVGWDSPSPQNALPETVVIPCGNTKTEISKLKRLTHNYVNTRELDNTPLPGFTLFKIRKKGYRVYENTWHVIDPRGFMVMISSHNLEKILEISGITEGLIQEKCVWARDDSNTELFLLPINAPEYTEAIKNTKLIEEKVDIADVQIGDTVLLQSGIQGIYLGVASMYGALMVNSYSKIGVPGREVYTANKFLRRQVIEYDTGKYFISPDVKVLSVINRTNAPLTQDEAIVKMNHDILSGGVNFSNYPIPGQKYFWLKDEVYHVSAHAVQNVELTFHKIDYIDAVRIFNDSLIIRDPGKLLLESIDGEFFIPDIPHVLTLQSISQHAMSVLGVAPVDVNKGTTHLLVQANKGSRWNPPAAESLVRLDSFSKYYTIVKHIKKQTYV